MTLSVITLILLPMSPTLQEDLRQTKPFSSLQQEAYLSVVRTTSALIDRVEDLLKPYGIRELTRTGVTAMTRGMNLK